MRRIRTDFPALNDSVLWTERSPRVRYAVRGRDWIIEESNPSREGRGWPEHPWLGKRVVRGRASCGISPLTPTLSPLRGEGDAMEASGLSIRSGRARRCSIAGGGALPAAARFAETGLFRPATVPRAPSPLNGGRAGVRGGANPTRPTAKRIRHPQPRCITCEVRPLNT